MIATNPGSRLAGLGDQASRHVVAAAQALDAGRVDAALAHLREAQATRPDHPEVLRLFAGALSGFGRHGDAIRAIQKATMQRPADALYHSTFGTVLATAGEHDAAAEAFQHAVALKPDLASAWYNLGVLRVRGMRNVEAAEALGRALALAPDNLHARVQLADLLRAANRREEAAAEYRRVIGERACTGLAWWGLAELRAPGFSAADIEAMQAAQRDPRASDDDLVALGFALARALDDAGRYAESLAAIEQANTIARRRRQWDAAAFSSEIAAIERAFDPAPVPAGEAIGGEVVFVVGMPRSGSTLIEQILASHPQVEGAGEMPDLPLTIHEESMRRGQPLQQWAAGATADDWLRLGRRYLERTAHWRERKPVFVDKLPSNWHFVDAIRAMLPAAHIVVARRDPLETCFSCYRQYLVDNEYARTAADLAACWRDFDRAMRGAARRHASHLLEFEHAELIDDPEARIRALLEFAGLPFDPACLEFHRSEREVRSPSAMQVRAPLQRDTAHSLRYGALLDPLRAALGLPPFEAAGARS